MSLLDEQVSREGFIDAMRNVAASVTVITSDGPAGRSGATASSFTSVSADPPTVLVCLRAESRVANAVRGNQKFCVNVLSQLHHYVADRFAGMHDNDIDDRFQGIDVAHGAEDVVLNEATAFSCSVQDLITSGSHLIVLGCVNSVATNNKPPLAYMNGQYHRVTPHPHDAETDEGTNQ